MRGFGDLESVIMHMVWDHDGPVTVRELFDELRQERSIAYTTVMSTMDNLHRKGWLPGPRTARPTGTRRPPAARSTAPG